MKGARPRVLIWVVAALAAVAVLAFTLPGSRTNTIAPRAPEQRPPLLLLTSLPLLFSEDFSLQGGSPALAALQTRYRVVPISVTDPAELGRRVVPEEERLDAPDERGPKTAQLGGYEVLTVSPGTLHGACAISADRLVAHCRIGKGRETVIADADVLDTPHLGGRATHNLDGLLAELARLERG